MKKRGRSQMDLLKIILNSAMGGMITVLLLLTVFWGDERFFWCALGAGFGWGQAHLYGTAIKQHYQNIVGLEEKG